MLSSTTKKYIYILTGPIMIAIYQFALIKDFWFHYDEWIYFKRFEEWHEYVFFLYESRHIITIPNYLFKFIIIIFGHSTHVPNTIVLVFFQLLINVCLIIILSKKFKIGLVQANLFILLWLTNSTMRENFRWPQATALLISLLCALLIYLINNHKRFPVYLNLLLLFSTFSSGWIYATIPIVILSIFTANADLKKKIYLALNAVLYPAIGAFYSLFALGNESQNSQTISINLFKVYILEQLNVNLLSITGKINSENVIIQFIFILLILFSLYGLVTKKVRINKFTTSELYFIISLLICYTVFVLSVAVARSDRGLEILQASRYLYLTNLLILITLLLVINRFIAIKFINLLLVAAIIFQSFDLKTNLESDRLNEEYERKNFLSYQNYFNLNGKLYNTDYEECCRFDPALTSEDIEYIFVNNFHDIFSVKK
jgi:hypothetical protein